MNGSLMNLSLLKWSLKLLGVRRYYDITIYRDITSRDKLSIPCRRISIFYNTIHASEKGFSLAARVQYHLPPPYDYLGALLSLMRIEGRLITVSEEEKLLRWETASPVCVSMVCVCAERMVERGLQRVLIRERRKRDGERDREIERG